MNPSLTEMLGSVHRHQLLTEAEFQRLDGAGRRLRTERTTSSGSLKGIVARRLNAGKRSIRPAHVGQAAGPQHASLQIPRFRPEGQVLDQLSVRGGRQASRTTP
jgi:hypothetical protein